MNEAGTAGSVGCPRLRQQWRKNVLPQAPDRASLGRYTPNDRGHVKSGSDLEINRRGERR